MRVPFQSKCPILSAACKSLAIAALLFVPSRSESPWKPNATLAMLQIQAPWHGPGAAIFNPAFLSETGRMYAGWSYLESVSGKAGQPLWQGAAGLPAGFKVGLAWVDNSSTIDGNNAIYLDYLLSPMAAWSLDDLGGTGFNLGLGAAFPYRGMNAFNVVESSNISTDIGVNLIFPEMGVALGRIHLALAAQSLFGGKVKLPEDNPPLISSSYDAQKLAFEATALWSNLGGMVDLYWDQKLQTGTGGGSEGPGSGNIAGGSADLLIGYGVEFRPIRYFGVKVERTWLGYWTAGACGNIPIKDFNFGLEFNLTHDKLADKDEGRGMLWAMGISLSY